MALLGPGPYTTRAGTGGLAPRPWMAGSFRTLLSRYGLSSTVEVVFQSSSVYVVPFLGGSLPTMAAAHITALMA